MVGSSLWRKLYSKGYKNLIGKNSNELDLRIQKDVNDFYFTEKPDIVINAAAKVGGILANNNYPYQFIMENMQIQNNLIDGAFKCGVDKFVFLGSSCIYPKNSPQPIKEKYLLSDYLESTNEWYALAKISGVKACESIRRQYSKNYFSFMPTNLYGYNDNFDLETSHVLPALIRKFHEAKINNHPTVTLWGSGKPRREFLFVDDLAGAVIFALENNLSDNMYNVGSGTDISISNLAKMIQKIVDYDGQIIWDKSKPDGTPRKLMDVSKMRDLGWVYSTDLKTGIQNTYNWYLRNIEDIKELKLNK
tara:strand:+ start:2061 stop:2975 length:915 start_codon:yes stop_codon:yes gene_type:complete